MSLSRFLSQSLPVERLLDPEEPGAAGGGGEYLRRNKKSEKYIKKNKNQARAGDVCPS